MRLAAGRAHGDDLVIELLPFRAEHQAARNDHVDLVGAVGDRRLDFLEPRRQRGKPVREGGGDGGDMDAGSLDGVDGGRDERVVDADRRRPDRRGFDAQRLDDVAAERVDGLGAQPPHALLGVVAVQRRQVHAGDGAQQPGRLVVALDAAPLGQRRDAPLQRAAVDVAHRFQEAEVERHAGVARDAVAALGRRVRGDAGGERRHGTQAGVCHCVLYLRRHLPTLSSSLSLLGGTIWPPLGVGRCVLSGRSSRQSRPIATICPERPSCESAVEMSGLVEIAVSSAPGRSSHLLQDVREIADRAGCSRDACRETGDRSWSTEESSSTSKLRNPAPLPPDSWTADSTSLLLSS